MTKQANIQSFFCLVILIAFGPVFTKAQSLPENILVERITIPGTIRSSQLTNIIQDNTGMIWLSGDGLYRYDGFKFRQYREVANRKEFLNPQDLLCLLSDSVSNRVLLGTRRFGIVTYDYKTDKLNALSDSENAPIINQLTQTSDGTIWAASFSGGLYYLKGDSLQKLPDPEKTLLHPISFTTSGSKLYVGELGKIAILENGKIQKQIKLSWQGKDLPVYTQATALHFDRDQKLWIGTEKQGVLVYDLKAEKFVQYFQPTKAPFFSRISRILQDKDGWIWILTKASGVVVYSPEKDQILPLLKDPFSMQSISSDNCFSIMEDREGIIWIGATGDINKYDRKQIKFRHINHNPLEKLSLSDNMVRGVYEDHQEKLWIGTDGGYINIIDLRTESISHLKVKLQNDSTNYVPLHFLELNERLMLIGSSLGLLQYDRETKKFSPYKPLWPLTERRIIRQLLKHENKLYFIYNGMFFVHDFPSGQTESYRNAGDSAAINITSIFLDDQHRLWIGSNGGVSLFDSIKKTFLYIPFKKIPTATDGSLLLVLSIHQVDNKLYIGTFNAGMWELDISEIYSISKPKNYLDHDGLPSNTVYATINDENGNLWLSTNNGIVKFEPKTKQFTSFSISEGVQEEEFNRLAYIKTKDGQIVFGGINGINAFRPEEVPIENEKIRPEILSVTASNPLAKNPTTTRVTHHEKEINFEFDQNFISIHFFVPHYKQPKRYTLFYKLENFEKEWREVSNENMATYANLRPGTYNFLLKTVGINGEETTLTRPIIIKPPYWKEWWFVLISVCVIAFLVGTIIRSYVSRAHHDRERLEQLLKIRTSEIEKSKEELQILNQKKDLIFSILSHDLRSPLTTLKGFLGYIIDHADGLTTEELKRHATSIRNSVTNSLDLIDNTLFWSLSQMGNIQYTPTNFSLTQLLDKLRGLYQLTADKKRIPLTISCDEEIMIHGDENMVYVTVRNLVSNALKFTTEGNPVSITCTCANGYVEINVIDRGIGMSQEYLQKILSQEQPMLKKGTSNEKGTGLGLLLCKQFIEMNKGELKITSIENTGTTFTVVLPLAIREHTPPEIISSV